MQGRKGDDEIRGKMAELVMVCDKESEIRQQRLQNATFSLHKSLRSSKSNADQTISINGMTDQRLFVNKHNMVVGIDLNQPGIEYYRPILEFLRRSRVHHVVTNTPPLMITYIRQFWDSAHIDCFPSPPVIRARINNTDIAFSAEDLRGILRLGTVEQENGPTEYPFKIRMGAFQRMGYSGDLLKAPYIKSFLYGQWRFLMHVLIVALAPKKAGWDAMNAKLQSAMLSLVYNKPFSFSQFFFDEFKQQIQIGARDKFLLYPRFVMMIIRHRLSNLPPLEDMVQVSTVDRRIYADCVAHHTKRLTHLRPQETALFGHLVDVNYVAPPGDGWMDVAQLEGAVPQPDVVPEVNVQEPQQVEGQVNAQEVQQVIEEVLHQLEQPQQGVDPVDRGVTEVLVQDVLNQGQAPEGDAFAEVEAYTGDVPDVDFDDPADIEGVDKEKGKIDDATADVGTTANDSDDDDDDSNKDYRIQRERSRVILVKTAVPSVEGSSRDKRKERDDIDYTPTGEGVSPDEDVLTRRTSRPKRLKLRQGGVSISARIPATQSAQTTTTIPITSTSTPVTSTPTPLVTGPSVADHVRITITDPVDPNVAEVVVQEVLQQGVEQGDDVFAEIDAYMGDVQDTGDDVVRDDDDDAQKEGDNVGDKDSEAPDGDSDNDDGDDDDDYVIMQYGSKLVSVKRSGPPPESSSRGKRKMHADDYEPDVDESRLKPRQSKARRSSITEPAVTTTTTAIPTATTTTTIPVPTSSTTTTTVPTTSLPADSVHVTSPSEISRFATLEAQVASLNAQVAMLTAILAKQDERLQSVARMTENLEGKIDRIKFIFTNMNPKNPSEEYSFTIRLENDIYAMLDCHPHLSEAKKLIQELNVTNGLYSFVRTMRAKFQEVAAVGSLPKITSNPQETTIISMSAPFSSVSTDSGSSAKDDHSRQANRVGRKLRNVQGIQSSVLSPGSASSLRRSPRFKVKK